MKKLFSLFLLFLFLMEANANNFYVSTSTGNDTNNGTKNNPFKTITKALSMANANDSILVEEGTYFGGLDGEVFPLMMKSDVKLVSLKGAEATIINAGGADTTVLICSSGSSQTLVKGFSITGGHVRGNSNLPFAAAIAGGVFFKNNDSTIFENNWVRNNSVEGYQGTISGQFSTEGGSAEGAGIYIESNCKTMVRNCIISKNYSAGGAGRGYGGGFSGDPTPGGRSKGAGLSANSGYIINCIIYENTARGGPGGVTNSGNVNNLGNGGEGRGGGMYGGGSQAIVQNNIFMNNHAIGGLPGSRSMPGNGDYGAAYTFAGFSTNLFFGNTASTSENNGFIGKDSILGIDPLIHSPENFHLQTGSVCINRGSNLYAPLLDFDAAVRAAKPSLGPYEMQTKTVSQSAKVDSIKLGENLFPNIGVKINFIALGTLSNKEYVLVNYFANGRTGTIPTPLNSNFYWSISTSSDTLQGTIVFDWSNLGQTHLDSASLKLFHRKGPNTAWTEVMGSSKIGKTISASIYGFSEFAFGSSDTTVKVGLPTLNFNAQDVSIFPNPSDGKFTLSYQNLFPNSTVKIYNSLGKKVGNTISLSNTNGKISLQLDKGVYFIQIISNNGKISKKIIIQ